MKVLYSDGSPSVTNATSRPRLSRSPMASNALAHAGQHFTAQRMVRDYVCRFYVPMLETELSDEALAAVRD